jgi:hypothetical protein
MLYRRHRLTGTFLGPANHQVAHRRSNYDTLSLQVSAYFCQVKWSCNVSGRNIGELLNLTPRTVADNKADFPDALSRAILRGEIPSMCDGWGTDLYRVLVQLAWSSPEIDPALAERAVQLFDEQFGDVDDGD